MNDKVKIIVVLILGALIGFATVEVALRLVLPSRPQPLYMKRFGESERGKFTRYDPLLGWIGKENVENSFEWPDAKHRVKQNKYGFRGSEYPFERSAKPRILVLGDSYAWGFGVEDDEIFTSVIERKADNSIEVVNTGVSGYGTDQEYLLWREHGHKWKPDRVILLLTFVNDIADIMDPVRYTYNKPFFVLQEGALELTNVPVPKNEIKETAKTDFVKSGLVMRMLSRSVLVNTAVSVTLRSSAIRGYLESKGIVPKRQSGYEWEYLLYSPNFNNTTRPAWDKLFSLVGELNSGVRAQGAELSVVVVPSIIEVYPELWAKFLKSPSIPDGIALDPFAPIDRIGEWCRENNVGFIDVLPALREAAKSDPYLYYPINIHWTRKAHEIAANVILSDLKLTREGR